MGEEQGASNRRKFEEAEDLILLKGTRRDNRQIHSLLDPSVPLWWGEGEDCTMA
jgi:hypothetical protein